MGGGKWEIRRTYRKNSVSSGQNLSENCMKIFVYVPRLNMSMEVFFQSGSGGSNSTAD